MPDTGTPAGTHSRSPATPAIVPSDTSNRFHVARLRDLVVFVTPPRPSQALTRDEALVFASWIIAMCAEPLERPLDAVADIIEEITR